MSQEQLQEKKCIIKAFKMALSADYWERSLLEELIYGHVQISKRQAA